VKIIHANIFFILLLSSTLCFAHKPEEGKVLGTVGTVIHQTHAIHSQDQTNSPFLAGVGLLAEGDLGPKGGVEVGLFYIFKTYQRTFGNSLIVTRVHKVDVPVGYRFWITDKFSVAPEISSLFSVGNPQIIYNSVLSGDQSTSATALTEYAADLSVQWEAWTNNKFSFILDGRYSYSLSANQNEDANQYSIFFAIKYLVQEKPADKSEPK
jgi:hypothetical protein